MNVNTQEANRNTNSISRRDVLRQTGGGFGMLALASLLSQVSPKSVQGGPRTEGPLVPKQPHFPAKAKRVIFLFQQGCISQHDTFEYKPKVQEDDGKVGPGGGVVTGSKFKFAQHGQTGTWMSELLPNIAKHVDKLCFLRGLHTDTPAHPEAVIQMHTGAKLVTLVRPSIGAWTTYGLGSENQDLPGYITINPSPNFGGVLNYGSAFLPAHYQGTRISDTGYIPNLEAREVRYLQRKQIDYIQSLNRDFAASPHAPDQLDGIIQSYELAYKMQGKVPELLDLKNESQATLDAYGVKNGPEGSYARQCLMARRLSEAGVRFVEITQPGWDHHNNLHQGLITNCSYIDKPTSALLSDLEQRGLLEETLVIFGSEFGRLPTAQGADGRDHNITGYTMFLAGGGVKKGFSYGATDEYGLHAVENRMHMTDLHATILALIGLDHEQLTYNYAGRDFRLTDVAGNVAKEIFE
jgi:hypothetical protein